MRRRRYTTRAWRHNFGSSLSPSIMRLSEYLVERLAQLGAKHIFGCPGDYNMQFLDVIDDDKRVQWIGCANELNAAYACDGYTRATGEISVLVTTYGVGELSAANGVAGMFAESLPVIHIVGMPTTESHSSHRQMHHTLDANLYDNYYKMARYISVDAAMIGWTRQDWQNAAPTIDRVLTSLVQERRPVYLSVPLDLFELEVPSEELKNPIPTSRPQPNQEQLEYVVKVATNHFNEAKRPLVLVDYCVGRSRAMSVVDEFVKQTGLPVAVAPMGKSLFPEDDDHFLGVYLGGTSHKNLKDFVDTVDLLIIIGGLPSDMNTGRFSYSTPACNVINFHTNTTSIGYSEFRKIGMHEVLPRLGPLLAKDKAMRLSYTQEVKKQVQDPPQQLPSSDSPVIHDYLWDRIGSFLRAGDHMVVEVGSSTYGAVFSHIPRHARFHEQIAYGSIGWSVGATLGVSMGVEQHGGRCITFVGDGSLMMSVQEIATMMRYGAKPIIFVLNNDGYEIERVIHGPDREYNNIASVDFSLMLDFFNRDRKVRSNVPDMSEEVTKQREESHKHDQAVQKRYHAVRTCGELDQLLSSDAFRNEDAIHVVELFMPRGNAPDLLETIMGQKK